MLEKKYIGEGKNSSKWNVKSHSEDGFYMNFAYKLNIKSHKHILTSGMSEARVTSEMWARCLCSRCGRWRCHPAWSPQPLPAQVAALCPATGTRVSLSWSQRPGGPASAVASLRCAGWPLEACALWCPLYPTYACQCLCPWTRCFRLYVKVSN